MYYSFLVVNEISRIRSEVREKMGGLDIEGLRPVDEDYRKQAAMVP
jgi:hypothetical protein